MDRLKRLLEDERQKALVLYVNGIKNSAKKQYAKDYVEWMSKGKQGSEPKRPADLGQMGAQAVMMNIEQIMRGEY